MPQQHGGAASPRSRDRQLNVTQIDMPLYCLHEYSNVSPQDAEAIALSWHLAALRRRCGQICRTEAVYLQAQVVVFLRLADPLHMVPRQNTRICMRSRWCQFPLRRTERGSECLALGADNGAR